MTTTTAVELAAAMFMKRVETWTMARRKACPVSVGEENTRLHVELLHWVIDFLAFPRHRFDGVFDRNDTVVLLGVLEGQG